ncbi:YkvI family membrane protein [Hyphococcus sp.]|uniref:YkvI family membrane protein n=1 Tax=Hyphococcus sp. TaxID=2038636 RepID=UPI0035C6EFCA
MTRNFFKIYLLPGFVFQSVIIGGGYGTGREVAEFFLAHGALGGLFGLGVTAVAWSAVLAIAFEFARISRGYNYRTFFRALLGPAWRFFEILYLLIAVLVLAVLGSAAGEMVSAALHWPPLTGTLFLLVGVGTLAYFGGKAIERALACWSFLLYVVYGVFVVWVSLAFGGHIADAFSAKDIVGAWHVDGLRYASYNLIALGAVLFVLPYLETRKEALTSGVLAGLIGTVPGVFVYLVMLSQYPSIKDASVPVLSILEALNSSWFFIVFQIVLFGTFIETGVGIIHALNERVASVFTEKKRSFPHWARLTIAIGVLVSAIYLARVVGIVALIAQGYGALSYAFIAMVVLPLFTIGLYKILTTKEPEKMETAYEFG